jgi:hypothetical protein
MTTGAQPGEDMFLVICSSTDIAARWAYEGLKAIDLAPLELIPAESLGYTRIWEHRVAPDGAKVRFELPDGRTICSSRVRGVLNRLISAPQDLIQLAAPQDREYASGEMMAFHLSWMYALPGVVINRPAPQGLCGAWRHTSEWVMLASQAGLPVPVFRQSGHDPADRGYSSLAPPGSVITSLIVLAGEVFGMPVRNEITAGCRKLARVAGVEMLGIDFYSAPEGGLRFAAATPYPDFTIGGKALLKHMANVFRNGGAQ